MCYNKNMRKKRLIFYCITLLMFCQAGAVLAEVFQGRLAVAEEASNAQEIVITTEEQGAENTETVEISEAQQTGIIENCATIKDNLTKVQKSDARARVYLGRYYETILTKFVTPLNLRLVENNLSAADLVANQTKMAEARTLFTNDYVSYQKELESLVAMDCKEKAGEFHQQLAKVKSKRKIVEQDTLKMRNLISEHVKLAGKLRGKI